MDRGRRKWLTLSGAEGKGDEVMSPASFFLGFLRIKIKKLNSEVSCIK